MKILVNESVNANEGIARKANALKEKYVAKLVIQGSHMVSGTRCPAWSDQVKQ